MTLQVLTVHCELNQSLSTQRPRAPHEFFSPAVLMVPCPKLWVVAIDPFSLESQVSNGAFKPMPRYRFLLPSGGRELSKTFSRRLIWRDLAYWQLHHWPHMACRPMRTHYSAQVTPFRRVL